MRPRHLKQWTFSERPLLVSAVDNCVKFCVESLCLNPNPGGTRPRRACERALVSFFLNRFRTPLEAEVGIGGAGHEAAAPGICTMMASVAAAGAWSQAVLQTGGGRPSGGGRPPSCWHHCERCVGTMRPLCGVRAPSDREGEGGRGPQTLY